jgi:REP element-mobilizing transposase RayT
MSEIGEILDTPNARPSAYFITFSCYGARNHGAEKGSVDRDNNQHGTPVLPEDIVRYEFETDRMDQPPYLMDEMRRIIVLQTIREVSEFRKWELFAVHVRSNHVHVVVRADASPEKVMNDYKAYSSRRLNEAGIDGHNRKRWSRHGSTIYLWTAMLVEEKVHYTLHEQGDPMAVHPTEPRP